MWRIFAFCGAKRNDFGNAECGFPNALRFCGLAHLPTKFKLSYYYAALEIVIKDGSWNIFKYQLFQQSSPKKLHKFLFVLFPPSYLVDSEIDIGIALTGLVNFAFTT